MNNRRLVEQFAQGARKGTGSHMFIEDDAIYSYGRHFPVARRTPQGVLFNPVKFSNTTNRHQSLVRSALGGNVIEVAYADLANAKQQFERNESQRQMIEQKAIRARKDNSRAFYLGQSQELERKNQRLRPFII